MLNKNEFYEKKFTSRSTIKMFKNKIYSKKRNVSKLPTVSVTFHPLINIGEGPIFSPPYAFRIIYCDI